MRNSLAQLSRYASPKGMCQIIALSTTCLRTVSRRRLTTSIRKMATIVPPVTQDATSSKGPTAMVFMNMGGPSTTDEVGNFLSRLFVRISPLRSTFHLPSNSIYHRPTQILFLLVVFKTTLALLFLVAALPRSKNNTQLLAVVLLSENGPNINLQRCARFSTVYPPKPRPINLM